jgi:hypothetical protein
MVLKLHMITGLVQLPEQLWVSFSIYISLTLQFYLDEKLSNLDAMYSDRHDDLTSMYNLSTEEKLVLFQKNIELRTRESLQQQVNDSNDFRMKISIDLDGSIS